MKKSAIDRRIIKTRNALHAAMVRLLHNTKLEDITVTMLCREAGISRYAFYDHYSVPEDCFYEIAEETNREIVEKFQEEGINTIEEFMEVYFEYIKAHKDVFKTLFNLEVKNPALQATLKFYLDFLYKNVPDFPVYPALYEQYLVYGLRGLVQEWIDGDCKSDYHAIADMQVRIYNLLKTNILAS